MGDSGHDIDPTFYRSPADAISAPPEQLAYVVAFDRAAQQPDALAVLGTDPESAGYGQVVGWADLPTRGDELHHFGWNACSSAFAHAGHDTDGSSGLQRRYLLLPGLRSSNIHVYDTHPDPRVSRPWPRRSARPSWPPRPATPARTPCTAARTASSCPASAAATGPRARAASPCSTTTPSTCCGPGRPIAGTSTWPTTPGGT